MRVSSAECLQVRRLIDAVIDGEAAHVELLLAPLDLSPDDPLTGRAFMTTGDDVAGRLMGVQCLAGYARARGDIRMAAEVSLGLVDAFTRMGYFDSALPPATLLMVANVLDACANTLPDAGYVPELLGRAPQWVAWLDRPELSAQWRAVHGGWVEACFHAGRYETASALLDTIGRRVADSGRSPIERRLQDKLDDLLRAVDRADTPSATLGWVIQRSLEQLTGGTLPAKLFEAIVPGDVRLQAERMGSLIGLGPAPASAAELVEAVRLLPTAAHPFHETSNILEALGGALQKHDDVPHVNVAALADQARTHAHKYGFWEQAASLGWVRSVALRRAGLLQSAADELALLRGMVRERQRGISDPLLRAALAEYLPHLWAVNAAVLFALGEERTEELFEVVEESKGRILSALTLERQHGRPDRPALARVRELLGRSMIRASYLTLLADHDETYAVIVEPSGRLRAARLALGRVHLAAAAQELAFVNDGEPGSLVRAAGVDPDRPFDSDYTPALQVLTPLAQWLALLFDDGALRDDDVLCVSPDGPLYDLPIAAVDMGGRMLLERVALTLAPCVDVLDCCARSRPVQSRKGAFAIAVPRSTEFNRASYDSAAYELDATTLARLWATTKPPAEHSDTERLLTEDLSAKVVHLACHGHFDPHDPLGGSGLYLASGGALPPGVGHDGRTGLLNPKLAARLAARGAHCTLRACVSGRTTEVTSREALGMIWALFQAGATSVVAAAWNVDVRSASDLLARFYLELGRHDSAPLALRAAALGLRNVRETWQHPYHFAAFNAFGYWQ